MPNANCSKLLEIEENAFFDKEKVEVIMANACQSNKTSNWMTTLLLKYRQLNPIMWPTKSTYISYRFEKIFLQIILSFSCLDPLLQKILVIRISSCPQRNCSSGPEIINNNN